MKTYTFITISLCLVTLFATAQTDLTRHILPKGYYSIGDNHKKLTKAFFKPADTFVFPVIGKGYYSIKDNNKKLGKQSVWFCRNTVPPVITKGYYSIGNNARKLVE